MATTVNGRTFDRIPQPDPQNWPVRSLLMALDATKPRSYTWPLGVRLDQGQDGACVGFSFSHELAARPFVVPDITNASAYAVYKGAQANDEWPGDDYDGSSVLGGAKYLTGAGYYAEYRWAQSVSDLALAVGHHGPAVLGINWRDGMFDPDADGTLHVQGDVVGGHAICVRGVSNSRRRFRLPNSWGESWGVDGECFVSFDDMELLLSDQGEACIPVVRLRKRA